MYLLVQYRPKKTHVSGFFGCLFLTQNHPAKSSFEESYRTQLRHHLIQLRIGGVPNLWRFEAPDDVQLPLGEFFCRFFFRWLGILVKPHGNDN